MGGGAHVGRIWVLGICGGVHQSSRIPVGRCTACCPLPYTRECVRPPHFTLSLAVLTLRSHPDGSVHTLTLHTPSQNGHNSQRLTLK